MEPLRRGTPVPSRLGVPLYFLIVERCLYCERMVIRSLIPVFLLLAAAPVWAQSIWRPALETSWQWQLTGNVDLTVDVQMFDLDLFNTDAATVATLHARGRKAVCYVSVGTFEPFRPDAAQFPASVKGKALADFPDENWLDIRQINVLGPIMEARLDLCRAKGFDGVEPDNVDGYANRTGFPLTADDQIRFNRYIADAAHARGLSVGLKNDLDQVADLVPYFDWALNEQCFQYSECTALSRFIAAGKAVFQVEYERTTAQFCTQANTMNFNSMRKNIALDSYRQSCREVPSATVTNGASFATAGLAPGQIATVFGTDLGPASGASLELTSAGTLSSALAGTRILFNGQPAPLIFANATQVTAIVPYAIAGKAVATVEVERNGVKRPAVTFPIVAAQPGLFTIDGSQVAAINEDGTINSLSSPAPRGSVVALYATGEGQTDPDGVESRINSGSVLPKPKLPVIVKIGGAEAQVLYAGAAPGSIAGLMQLNVRIPASISAGKISVSLSIGGMMSQAGATVAVR